MNIKTERKKIVIVSRCAWTTYNFRSGLIRTLVENGHDVSVACGVGDGYEDRVRNLGVIIFPLPISSKSINFLNDVRLLWRLYCLYKAESPDIVHNFTIKPVIYGSIAAGLSHIPRIVNTITGLGYVFTSANKKLLKAIVKAQYKVALRFSHITFFQNSVDRNYFVSHGIVNTDKTNTVPGSGVNLDYFKPVHSKKLDDKKSIMVTNVTMISRLLKDKGVIEFIEAVRRLKKESNNICVRLVGDPDPRNPTSIDVKTLRAWVDEGLVLWDGKTDDVRTAIAVSDIIVLPSYREGLPRVLLEAAAMGKPIITTDVEGCRDVVDHEWNGLLVPAKNSKLLAEAILQLVNDPEKRVLMGNRGVDKIKKSYDEKIVFEKTFEAYGLQYDKSNIGTGVLK